MKIHAMYLKDYIDLIAQTLTILTYVDYFK